MARLPPQGFLGLFLSRRLGQTLADEGRCPSNSPGYLGKRKDIWGFPEDLIALSNLHDRQDATVCCLATPIKRSVRLGLPQGALPSR